MRRQRNMSKPPKWTCWLCGRLPIDKKRLRKDDAFGTPSYERPGFKTKLERDRHVRNVHEQE